MKKILFLTLFIVTQFFPAKAAHIVGGEMHYKCLGNDVYEITMILYRDCNGGGACFDSQVEGCNTGVNLDGTVSIFLDTLGVMDITLDEPIIENLPDVSPLPPGSNIPSFICIERGIYTFEVTLPQNSIPYTIIYQRCCRNSTISNLIAPGETGITIFTTIDTENECNSSPYFELPPKYFVYIDEPFEINFSANDSDGDSLVYELCNPLMGGGSDAQNWWFLNGIAPNPDAPPPYSSAVFAANYDAQNPIPCEPAISLDIETGILTGTPTTLGQFAFAVCVREFRNGIEIGQIRREIQLNVIHLIDNTIDQNLNEQITIFPNPANNELNIQNNGNLEIESVLIYSFDRKQLIFNKKNPQKINLSNLPKGIYYSKITTEKGIVTKKFIKQ